MSSSHAVNADRFSLGALNSVLSLKRKFIVHLAKSFDIKRLGIFNASSLDDDFSLSMVR
ncbi:MAG: hypothetical protein MR514_05385 [Succinivibrio sp.]|nr:hypothetical protein [Succinivibrio sp.]MCI7773277.1 hypothetical protein [Succinivibrio sp.]